VTCMFPVRESGNRALIQVVELLELPQVWGR